MKRFQRFQRWRRRRAWIKASEILRKESEFHIAAGHLTQFEAVNESLLILRCTACPNLQPQKRKRRKK